MKKNILLIFAAIALIFSACLKDKEVFEEYPNTPATWLNQQKVKLNVNGEILDEKGNPLANAKISVGGQQTTTDKRGFFIFKNVSDTPDRVYVQVEKNGFFKGSRVFRASPKADNYLKIILLEKKKVATFSAKTGSKVSVGKTTIQFSKNSFKDAAGKPYEGNVNVEAKYLDPSNADTYLQMPGNMQGINFKGEEQILGTYGMVVCELTDNAGNLINLNGDSTATITYPITQKFQSSQPSTVPLWYFDETVGAWREEGISTLVGNTYVGKVKHFSFWNCDYPFPSVKFETTIKDENGNPIQGITVALCFPNGSDSSNVAAGYGWTDANGWVGGLVPKNQAFTLKVMASFCSKTIYSQQIGPFANDVILPTIVIDKSKIVANLVKIQGKLTDCSGNNAKNAYAYITAYAKGKVLFHTTLITDSSGNYATTLLNNYCYTSSDIDNVSVIGVDYTTNKESDLQTFPVVSGNNNLGTVNLCNVYSEFLKLNVNGKDYNFKKPNITTDIDLLISGSSDSTATSGSTSVYFNIKLNNSTIIGTYPSIWGTCLFDGVGVYFGQIATIPVTTIPVVMTKVATKIGDYYEGNINSVPPIVLDGVEAGSQATKPYTIKGSFKLKRTN